MTDEDSEADGVAGADGEGISVEVEEGAEVEEITEPVRLFFA